MIVDVWLYGPLARYGGNEDNISFANKKVELAAKSTLNDLLAHLNLPTNKRGMTFINYKLTAMPGIQPDLDRILNDGDRIALFHLKSMWPFQYRDGATMAEGAIEHWRTVPQNTSYFMMSLKGGHNPNLTKLTSKSAKLKAAQTQLFYLSISAGSISNDDIDDVNIYGSPANIWKLYLQKDRHVSTGIENDLQGISVFESKVH